MTYCVGLLLDSGLVMASDTRTNAGMDSVGKFKKMHSWTNPGHSVFILMTAGNLAATQGVVSLLSEHAKINPVDEDPDNLFAASSMFHAARMVGRAVREVRKVDGEVMGARSDAFSASFILGGQIGSQSPRLFQIYAEGNFIEATADTPFFQIGEHKYGKPILDRVARPDMILGDAAKMVLLSFDSTLRSNLSVGLPIDMLTYETGSLKIEHTKRIGPEDPYFKKLSSDWSAALRTAFLQIDPFDI